MKQKLPNFLIAGATKCGSSSLNKYIQQHPNIFMSPHKEPRFLTSQIMNFPMGGPGDKNVESWYVKDFENYKSLFQKATTQKIIGEASVDTIYFYDKVIPIIQQYLGDPKILIILRDPTKRAFSAYQHLVRDKREVLPFEEALAMEKYRIAENYELIYHYTTAGLYYEQVKAFINNFSNVKIITIEEFNQNKQQTFTEIFQFLEIDSDVEIETEITYNVSGVPKRRWMHNLILKKNKLKSLLKPFSYFLSQHQKDKILNYLSQKNMNRLDINYSVEKQLQKYFQPDIKKLEKLLNKDFNIWLNTYS